MVLFCRNDHDGGVFVENAAATSDEAPTSPSNSLSGIWAYEEVLKP
jgi:hypothetical protein